MGSVGVGIVNKKYMRAFGLILIDCERKSNHADAFPPEPMKLRAAENWWRDRMIPQTVRYERGGSYLSSSN